MESGLITFFAWLGICTAYSIAAIIVGVTVAQRTRRALGDEGSAFLGCIGGIVFPITVVVGMFVAWIAALIKVAGDKPEASRVEESEALAEVRQRVRDVEETVRQANQVEEDCNLGSAAAPSKPIEPFKAGDIVTGVPGNPRPYEHLYEGCKCRVLKMDGSKLMKVLLIGHTDKDAHAGVIGKTYKANPKYFTLVKVRSTKTKKVTRKAKR